MLQFKAKTLYGFYNLKQNTTSRSKAKLLRNPCVGFRGCRPLDSGNNHPGNDRPGERMGVGAAVATTTGLGGLAGETETPSTTRKARAMLETRP